MANPRPLKVYPHEFLFKCEWDSTALKIKVGADNLKQATVRAWGRVSKMEGGMSCLRVTFVQQLK